MRNKIFPKGEVVNNCTDIARVLENIDEYINSLRNEINELTIENERLIGILDENFIIY